MPGGLIALLGFLRQALVDDALELDRDSRAQARDRVGLLVEYRVENRLLVKAFERQTTGRHLIEHHAEGPDIGAMVGLVAQRLLGRHVGRGADGCALAGQLRRRRGQLRQAEIHHDGAALGGDHDVGRFDVAMDGAVVVGFLEPLGHLNPEIDQPVDVERPLADHRRELAAFEIGHRDERLPIGLIDLVDRANVGVVQRRRGTGFAKETGLGVFRAECLGGKEFERNEPLQPQILGFIDNAHPAFPEFFENFVMGDGLPDHSSVVYPIVESRGGLSYNVRGRAGGVKKSGTVHFAPSD